MANPEHLAILKQGVEAWNAWREANPQLEPDLGEEDLSQLLNESLSGADFSSTRFFRSCMRGATLADANLAHANLRLANLSRCCLARARLPRADLFSADLSQADLRDANLQVANVAQATFRYANLDGADLSRANLFGTVLENCSLRNVSLAAANLYGTQLSASDVDGATFFWTRLGRLDLSRVQGLETARHLGPSSVDVDTLVGSGKLPTYFLKGLGVPQTLIDVLPAVLTGAAGEDHHSTFISYSHTDKPFARRLHDQLQAKGIRCWLDEKKLKPGDRILDVVDGAIRLHDKLLICCSRASLEGSWWVKDEIRKAQERERKEDRAIIIPLNLDGYLFEWQDGLASDLTSRLAADFTGWQQDNAKFEAEFERVVEALRA